MLQRFTKFIIALGFVPALFIATAPGALADVTTTGPNSSVTVTDSSSATVTNNNNLSVTNTSTQTSYSGSANVSNNTTGGSATSGDASNSNSTSTSLQITNLSSMPSSDGSQTLSTTGPNSPIYADFSTHTTITNNNNVEVENHSYQRASTGSANVSNNTTGGNATSGNASNSNCTSTSISINNGGGGGQVNNACGQPGGGQGGNNGGGSNNGSGGQVLGASFTVASIAGGKGAAFATLPNTGLREGVNAWLLTSILTLAASILYWSKVIAPRLKNI
jgi:hypothetical protein